ncbi:MAG: hypothetical protein J6X78_05890 [Treponema sp.]|nr:hypothetical protein [Treponema sp.]
MKKIVGIIAALALAGSVFADPDVVPVVATFDGNASLEWIANLDAETTGMKNNEEATFKVKFIAEGTKETSGDGLWGVLKIKAAETAVEAKHTTGGDTAGVTWVIPTPTVETAKIHFVDGDTFVKVNIKAPGLSLGNAELALATASPWNDANVGVTLTGAQGFTVEAGIPAVDFNLQFADNGQQKSDAKEFGIVFDATLKGAAFDVDGLAVTAGFGYSTEKDAATGKDQDAAIFARATYKLEIDDAMYVRPTVSFGLKGEAKQLVAGVLYGWGAEGQEPGFAKFSNGTVNINDKCADGVSIALKSTLADKAPMGFLFGFYDNKLLADYGIKIAAQLEIADLANFGDGAGDAFDFALVYGSGDAFGDWKVAANLGAKFLLAPSKFGMLYAASVTNSAIIQNTDLYVKYSGEHAAEIGAADLKGSVTLGAKIHF